LCLFYVTVTFVLTKVGSMGSKKSLFLEKCLVDAIFFVYAASMIDMLNYDIKKNIMKRRTNSFRR